MIVGKEIKSYRIRFFKVVNNKIFAIKISGTGSGRCGHQVRGGQGGRGGQVRGRAARGYSYSDVTTKHKGLCSAIGIHVFD